VINKFPGSCGECHDRVAAGAGQAVNQDGRWRTYHNECAPRRVAPPRGGHGGWHELPLVGFDLEGTSTQPLHTRIVSAALVHSDGRRSDWLIDPAVPIPADATAVHGITDEHVRRHGRPAAVALAELATAISKLIADATPLVAFCAQYDVTALAAELARHALPPVDWDRAIIIDPSILHREVEPRWSGSRQLGELCGYYEVTLANAHDAAADAQAALELARSIAARHPHIAGLPPAQLHGRQIEWFAAQGRDLQAFFDRKGRRETVSLEWPLETAPRPERPRPTTPPT